MARAPRVTLYSSANCPHCKRAREFLRSRKVPFQELDVGRSVKARKRLESLGARGVPVILVGDTRVDGFDPGRLARALREHGIAV